MSPPDLPQTDQSSRWTSLTDSPVDCGQSCAVLWTSVTTSLVTLSLLPDTSFVFRTGHKYLRDPVSQPVRKLFAQEVTLQLAFSFSLCVCNL